MKIEFTHRCEVGSCNNCQTRETDLIYEIEFKTTAIRLCYDCLKLLNELMENHIVDEN